MTATVTAPDRWVAHLRKHGPADPGVRTLLLELARYADADGRTGYTENGRLIPMRLAPCRECGLGLDS
jgi:hypothetical protein